MEVHCDGEQIVIYICITEPIPLFQERKKGSRKFELLMESIRPYKTYPLLYSSQTVLFRLSARSRDQRPPQAPRKICDIRSWHYSPTKERNFSLDLGVTFQGPFPTCLPPILQFSHICVFRFFNFQALGRE